MADFPETIASLINPAPSDPRSNPSLAGRIDELNAEVIALEGKVGADSSIDQSSLDYKIRNIVSTGTGILAPVNAVTVTQSPYLIPSGVAKHLLTLAHGVSTAAQIQQGDSGASYIASGTSHSVLGSNVTAGSTVVLAIICNTGGAADVASITSDFGSGFVGVIDSGIGVSFWILQNATGGGHTITINTNDGAGWTAQAREWPPASSYASGGTAGNVSSPADLRVSPGAAEAVVIACAAGLGAFSAAPTSPWVDYNGSSVWSLAGGVDSAYVVTPDAGPVDAIWQTTSGFDIQVIGIILFYASTGGAENVVLPPPTAGMELDIGLLQDATGGVSWDVLGAIWTGTTPTPTTAANALDWIHCICLDGAHWIATAYVDAVSGGTPIGSNPITITSSALPAATVGVSYIGNLTATSTAGGVSWITADPLPTGLNWSGNLSIIGVPAVSGTFVLHFTVKDVAGNTQTVTFSLVVNPGTPIVSGSFASIISNYPNGAGNTPEAQANAQLVGLTKFPVIMGFLDGSSLASMAGGAAGLAQWATSLGSRLICPVNFGIGAASGAPNAADVASGAENATAVTIGNALVANGQANAIIRIGWEMNLSINGSGNVPATGTQFLAGWHQIVTSMRSVSGQNFKFFWNPSIAPDNPADAYLPPASEVDIVGPDIYDRYPGGSYPGAQAAWEFYKSIANPCLDQMAAWAAELGAEIGIGEWGVGWTDQFGTAGGDNAYFVNQTIAWLASLNSLFATTWDDGGNAGLPGTGNPQCTAALRAAVAAS